MKVKLMKTEIEIPKGVTCQIDGSVVKVKGQKGDVIKSFPHPRVTFRLENNHIILESTDATKREKTIHNTFRAHLRNMFKGAANGHTYKLKICSGHFPMNVSVNNKQLIIKNFLGEKVPRVLGLKEGAEVKIEGDRITVTSISKEIAGQVAADIETLTHVKGRDLRIFQDGIYITDKDGKEL
jgi:large subunit ribosomal protein L6